jgi:hypothetical protein
MLEMHQPLRSMVAGGVDTGLGLWVKWAMVVVVGEESNWRRSSGVGGGVKFEKEQQGKKASDGRRGKGSHAGATGEQQGRRLQKGGGGGEVVRELLERTWFWGRRDGGADGIASPFCICVEALQEKQNFRRLINFHRFFLKLMKEK